RELMQHGAAHGAREPHLGDHLVGGRGGGVVPLEELFRRDDALPARPVQHDLRPEQQGEQAPFGRRIGVGDAAAERAPGPDRVVPDPPCCPGEDPEVRPPRGVGGRRDGPVRGQRPDPQPVTVGAEVGQARYPGDIDQGARPGQPEVHHRDQAEPAGQDLGLVAEFGKQRDRLGHAAGPVIGERGWFHSTPPSLCKRPAVLPGGAAGRAAGSRRPCRREPPAVPPGAAGRAAGSRRPCRPEPPAVPPGAAGRAPRSSSAAGSRRHLLRCRSLRSIWYTIFQHAWLLPATWGVVPMTRPRLRAERSPHGFRRLLLASPERHNPLDAALARALRDAFAENPGELVVLGSTGQDVFCAGADMTIGEGELAEASGPLYPCREVMITRPGAVMAAVGGPAVAGGAQLAAAADLRIAGPAARFRWIGPPGRDLAVGAWVLPDLVGRGRAAELAMTGRWVDAAEALTLGLVNRVEPGPLPAAEQLAATLAAGSAGSVARIKMTMTATGLLDRLHAEQEATRVARAEALAADPVPPPP